MGDQKARYLNHRDELIKKDGIIFKGHKIFIPRELCHKMMHAVHLGHMGVEKFSKRVGDIFWRQVPANITNMILDCTVYLERRNAKPKEPLISQDVPDNPRETISYRFAYMEQAVTPCCFFTTSAGTLKIKSYTRPPIKL